MIDCTLVTCEIVPELDPDDRLLLDELRKRGLSVSIALYLAVHTPARQAFADAIERELIIHG
jgi:hypothetical protein